MTDPKYDKCLFGAYGPRLGDIGRLELPDGVSIEDVRILILEIP